MPLQIDAPQSNPLLVDMENSALSKLEKNDKGFFLMVEGASIDKSGHLTTLLVLCQKWADLKKLSKCNRLLKQTQRHFSCSNCRSFNWWFINC